MARELTIRVPSDIGVWVRQQPGSATDTLLALASDTYKRREYVSLPDPGPGEDRIRLRLAPRVLTFVRQATRSRDSTAAIRKLLRSGYEGRGLPASASRPAIAAPAKPESRGMPAPALVRALPPVADREAAQMIAIRYKENPELRERQRAFALLQTSVYSPVRMPQGVTVQMLELTPNDVMAEIVAHPLDYVFPLVVTGGLIVLLGYGLKWLTGLASAGKVVAGVATAAKVGPAVSTVVPWVPL